MLLLLFFHFKFRFNFKENIGMHGWLQLMEYTLNTEQNTQNKIKEFYLTVTIAFSVKL